MPLDDTFSFDWPTTPRPTVRPVIAHRGLEVGAPHRPLCTRRWQACRHVLAVSYDVPASGTEPERRAALASGSRYVSGWRSGWARHSGLPARAARPRPVGLPRRQSPRVTSGRRSARSCCGLTGAVLRLGPEVAAPPSAAGPPPLRPGRPSGANPHLEPHRERLGPSVAHASSPHGGVDRGEPSSCRQPLSRMLDTPTGSVSRLECPRPFVPGGHHGRRLGREIPPNDTDS